MKPIRVLIVDDESRLRKSLLRLLAAEGIRAEEAGDGDKALEALDAREYDVVLLDLKMPVLGGMDLLRRLRKAGRTEEVIVLTGYVSADDTAELAALDAFDYLAKPYDMDVLFEKIGAAAERRRQKRGS